MAKNKSKAAQRLKAGQVKGPKRPANYFDLPKSPKNPGGTRGVGSAMPPLKRKSRVR